MNRRIKNCGSSEVGKIFSKFGISERKGKETMVVPSDVTTKNSKNSKQAQWFVPGPGGRAKIIEHPTQALMEENAHPPGERGGGKSQMLCNVEGGYLENFAPEKPTWGLSSSPDGPFASSPCGVRVPKFAPFVSRGCFGSERRLFRSNG